MIRRNTGSDASSLRAGPWDNFTHSIWPARFGVQGEVEQAEKLALEANGMARELDHPFTLAFTLAFLSPGLFKHSKRQQNAGTC